jgi:hypothetical protein
MTGASERHAWILVAGGFGRVCEVSSPDAATPAIAKLVPRRQRAAGVRSVTVYGTLASVLGAEASHRLPALGNQRDPHARNAHRAQLLWRQSGRPGRTRPAPRPAIAFAQKEPSQQTPPDDRIRRQAIVPRRPGRRLLSSPDRRAAGYGLATKRSRRSAGAGVVADDRFRPAAIVASGATTRVLCDECTRPQPARPDECKGDKALVPIWLSAGRRALVLPPKSSHAGWPCGRFCFWYEAATTSTLTLPSRPAASGQMGPGDHARRRDCSYLEEVARLADARASSAGLEPPAASTRTIAFTWAPAHARYCNGERLSGNWTPGPQCGRRKAAIGGY